MFLVPLMDPKITDSSIDVNTWPEYFELHTIPFSPRNHMLQYGKLTYHKIHFH